MLNVIYALTCSCHPERGIRYVGLTRRGNEVRLRAHIAEARFKSSRPVQFWILSHGPENIISEVLEECPEEHLGDAEIRWIKELRSRGQADLNISPGGDMGNPTPKTEAQKREMSEKMRGIPKPPGHGANVSKARKGMRMSPESQKKRSETIKSSGVLRGNRAKLTSEDVLGIYALRGLMSGPEVSRVFNVHKNNIYSIWNGGTWWWLTGASNDAIR